MDKDKLFIHTNLTSPSLREDEIKWIHDNQERCSACGHLEIFHNQHCCVFCTVENCLCKDGEIPVRIENKCNH